jgi:drug/metabolite transporter (DMT)-like permease
MLTYLKLLITMALWGGTFVAGRMLAGVVPPFQAAFLRFSIAGFVLMLLLYRVERHFPRLSLRQCGAVLLLGLTGVFGYNVAFFTGLETVSAGRAGLIIALNPVGIALISALLRTEPLRPLKSVGVVISVFGAMLVVSDGHLQALIDNVSKGELMILGCVLCWGLYSVLGRRAMLNLSPLVAVTYSALAGVLLLAPIAVGRELFHSLFVFGFKAWGSLLYLAVFGTVAGFLWYYQAIREIGAVRSGVFINFVPVFALLFGYFWLDEPLTAGLLQGGVLVIAGAWITNYAGIWRKTETRGL